MNTLSRDQIQVPEGFKLHTENSAHLLLPDSNDAFLNPVQEFNRDLSVACIRVWAAERDEQRKQKWLLNNQRQRDSDKPGKRRKVGDMQTDTVDDSEKSTSHEKEYVPHGIVILEALSATGLRSIRYAKEIPSVKYVLANDLSPAACEAMRRNVEINGLGSSASDSSGSNMGKVRVNEGDACSLMYSHRVGQDRVDVVDLDPYGTAAPFIDAAVQCVKDDGLLCVTCTDLSVLASGNYPEKCFSNYGGVPVRGEYCHESSLRLVLNSIAMSAARYGRSIKPLLSLSIDFYVRMFIHVRTSPIEVKKLPSQISTFYICTVCQSYYEQPLGREVEQAGKGSSGPSYSYKSHAGPTVPQRCPECQSSLHMAGPMWSAPIHDSEFATKVVKHIDEDPSRYGTSTRIKGMVTVASEELPVPFYFTPSKIAGFFRCEVPSLAETTAALLHGGYEISRSHALGGSIKTTAPRSFIFDIMREWVKTHPVKMDNISPGQIAHQLLAKRQEAEISFEKHPKMFTRSDDVKLVRYQINPTPNWGPKPKAKRKRDAADEGN